MPGHNGGRIEVRRVAGALGAEVSGVDLAQELDGDSAAALRRALNDHLVIFFRDQDLSPERFLRAAQYFGEPAEYPMVTGIEGYPKILEVAKYENEQINFGGIWHSDTVYLECPPMATMLLARETPPHGGDTMFANQVMAYEALSDGMKRLLDGLVAVNDSAKLKAEREQAARKDENPEKIGTRQYTSEHPVVRTHPETGRKALYVNIAHTVRFKDMTQAESAPLLKFLFHHQVQPDFTCRFSWWPGSLAVWDNRSAQHNSVNDYHGHRRVMHRITLAGDRPR
ncbi:MAG: TauD/TfdA family dioxygenase [SAR324 cluster bacterium]|nr:TauD/TfdA family dioxygenase [SAR324 cluster bacterium]